VSRRAVTVELVAGGELSSDEAAAGWHSGESWSALALR